MPIALLRRQVADEPGEDATILPPRLRHRQFHRKRRAVSPLPGHDPPDPDDAALAGALVPGDVIVVTLAFVAGHQKADIAPLHVCLAIAEQSLGSRAERQDDAAIVDHDHRVGHGGEDRADMQFALAPRLLDGMALRDVLDALTEAAGRVGLVAQRDQRDLRQELGAVAADAPLFAAHRRYRHRRGQIARQPVRVAVAGGIEAIGAQSDDLCCRPAEQPFRALRPGRDGPAVAQQHDGAVRRPLDEPRELFRDPASLVPFVQRHRTRPNSRSTKLMRPTMYTKNAVDQPSRMIPFAPSIAPTSRHPRLSRTSPYPIVV